MSRRTKTVAKISGEFYLLINVRVPSFAPYSFFVSAFVARRHVVVQVTQLEKGCRLFFFLFTPFSFSNSLRGSDVNVSRAFLVLHRMDRLFIILRCSWDRNSITNKNMLIGRLELNNQSNLYHFAQVAVIHICVTWDDVHIPMHAVTLIWRQVGCLNLFPWWAS